MNLYSMYMFWRRTMLEPPGSKPSRRTWKIENADKTEVFQKQWKIKIYANTH